MNASATTSGSAAPLSECEMAVIAFRKMQAEGNHDAALSGALSLLSELPENRDLLLIQASSLRHLGRANEALVILDKLERLQPFFSLCRQEQGLCHVARKDGAAATTALLAAVNMNPALPMSWRMLEGVYRLSGDVENAATAARHITILKDMSPEVIIATSLFSDGDLSPAEKIIRAFLIRHGNHPEAMRLLARIGMARDVLDDAELLLEAVLTLEPDYRAARYDYAQLLVRRHKYRLARAEVDKLLALEPSHRDYRTLSAEIAVGMGEQDRAIGLYRDLLSEMTAVPDLHLWLAHALKTVGQVEEAVDHYRSAANLRPDFGDAYWSLANLKRYRFGDDEIIRMKEEEAKSGTAPVDRYHLCFALGKALEDRGEIEASWQYYARGNSLKRTESRYDPEVIEANTRRQIFYCTSEFFTSRASFGATAADPIFVVGLPRSGSTLLEQILASHSAVEGTQELPDIQRMVLEMQGRDPDPDAPRYPGVLADMREKDFRLLGEKYLEETQIFRSGNGSRKPFFIDKMPNNFRHIGLIHLILPNARIIDARREPMACCFSNLKQLFANGQEFTYSVEDIARYYRTYLGLMRHWDRTLPGRVLRMHHEDVIMDLEASVRRMLDYCGLPFEQACLDFHKNTRSVRTPSSEQVRQPIFRDGLDQWRKYAKFLDPLEHALGEALKDYRNDHQATASS